MIELLQRYGLAAACILAPIAMLIAFTIAIDALLPCGIDQTPASPAACSGHKKTVSDLGFTYDFAAQPRPRPAPKAGEATTVVEHPTLFLARNFNGRSNFAIASSFLFVTFVVTLIGSVCVIVGRVGWRTARIALALLVLIAATDLFIAADPFGFRGTNYVFDIVLDIVAGPDDLRGRIYVVDDLLDAADQIKGLVDFTVPIASSRLVRLFIHANSIMTLISVGMIMAALASVSIREPSCTPGLDDLTTRRNATRWLLAFASALLVVGVLARKTLVDWPTELLTDAQAGDLRPIANALTLQLGAVGTLAIFTAFTPAIVAWSFDVARFRRAQPISLGAGQSDDELTFAPMPMVLSIGAALAPLIASPLIDALKSFLG